MVFGIKRILLCNGAHLGDLVLASAVLPVLKSAFPKAEIGFLLGSWGLPVFENHIYIDHLHIFDHPLLNRSSSSTQNKKKQGDRTWHQALQEIKDKNYDVALDLYYFYKPNSGALIAKAEIPERIGFWAMPAHYHLTTRLFWDHRTLHMVENHGKFLEKWGIPEKHLSHLNLCLKYREENKNPLVESLSPKSYLVIHVGRRPTKTMGGTCLEIPCHSSKYAKAASGLFGKRKRRKPSD